MERRIRFGLMMALLLTALASVATAKPFNQQEFLRRFHENPAEVFKTIPYKSGTVLPARPQPNFKQRQAVRDTIIRRSPQTTGDEKSGFTPTDNPKDLVDNAEDLIQTLSEAEERGLMSANLEEQPWSDDYWAIYLGGVGVRYADRDFPHEIDWQVNRDYIEGVPVSTVINSSSEAIANLSPSEKYSLIVGDEDDFLTQYAWKEGEAYYEEYGEVETWFGICHGWAPASFMLDRPMRMVEVPAANHDFNIPFFPSDIKALASLLWAKTDVPTKFVGGRCSNKEPEVDDIGRVIDAECNDTNPGTFHMTLVNQIGATQRSFVMDASFDYEVWNQPVYSYEYRYFNPQTGDLVETLEDATVRLENYTEDKFAKYRDERARQVVGIMAKVSYMVETSPTHRDTDHPSRDALRTVHYAYDIELDADHKIIGGEWYQRAHPDFLWTPFPGVKARTRLDRSLPGTWQSGEGVPNDWHRYASFTSRYGQPLGKVVEALIEQSQQEER